MFHRAIDSEPVIAGVDLRCLEMTAYIEELRRGEIRAELIERHLQIGWLLLANDEARRRGMISFDTDAAHTGSLSNGLAGHSAGARFDNPEGSDPEPAVQHPRKGRTGQLSRQIDEDSVIEPSRNRRADRARRVDASTGQDPETKDADRHGHADRHRS